MLTLEEKGIFTKLCEEVGKNHVGIGTLGEKTLHRVLKTFFCPSECVHEIKLCGHIADAVYGGTIYEIQTGGLFPLKKKLLSYKETDYQIQVVVPVVKKKRLIWIDPESGEMTKARGTKAGLGKWRVLAEMIYLLPVFDFSGMSLTVAELAVDDYKLLDGYGEDKKKKATRYERLPTELLHIQTIKTQKDFAEYFFPDDLPSRFSSSDFSQKTNLRRRSLWAALKVLLEMKVIRTVGKKGNAVLYEKNSEA